MNRTLFAVTALAAGLATTNLAAQTTAAPAAGAQAPAAAPAAPVTPQAIPAKIAVIAFKQAIVATNEGQAAVAAIQKKYEPQKAKLDALGKEIESLQAQAKALPATATQEQKDKLAKDIDTKERQYQRDAQDSQDAYNGEIQEALGKIVNKLGATAVKYAQSNGFTMLVNIDGDPNEAIPTMLWWAQETDVTLAVINEYNKVSGVAAPPPSAPSATRKPAAPAGGATTGPKK